MAILKFRFEIARLKEQGVDFTSCVARFEGERHVREDPNHVLKRLAQQFRRGELPHLPHAALKAAVETGTTGVTHQAYAGLRKQNVADAQQLFSPAMAAALERLGYVKGAHVIRTLGNWHRY